MAASATEHSAPKIFAAICALYALLTKAVKDGVMGGRLSTGGSSDSLESSNSLGSSIVNQLQQSGFMSALPKLLGAAAAALEAAQHAPVPPSVLQQRIQVAEGAAAAVTAAAFLRSERAATRLLQLCATLVTSPHQVDKAAVALPTTQLCVAAMQYGSCIANRVSVDGPAPVCSARYLMNEALVGVVAVCSAWEQVDEEDRGAVAASIVSPEALQAMAMSLLTTSVLAAGASKPSSSSRASSSSSASSTTQAVNLDTPAPANPSQVAWQIACTHQSDVSVLQQQALQELGCTSRALMYAAWREVPVNLDSKLYHTFRLASDGFIRLTEHQPSMPDLDKPQQLPQLAESLAQLREGDSPPCGSRLLPCAALLRLVPAVLLEWLQKQAADGPTVGLYSDMFGSQLRVVLQHVQAHQKFWDRAAEVFSNVEQQLAPQWSGSAASKMFKAASRVAERFSREWQPPASHLVQLLHLTSSAGARIMTVMQQAPSATALVASSSSTGSSSGSRGGHTGDVPVATGSAPANPLGTALWHTPHGLTPLLSMVNRSLDIHATDAAAAAAFYSPSNDMAESGSGHTKQTQGGQDVAHTSLEALCSALQQTLPQLINLTEAALRSGVESNPAEVMAQGFPVLLQLSTQVLFMAGLQPGSPALQPLSGLVFTLLKVANSIIFASSEPEKSAALFAFGCLSCVLSLNSLVVQAACAAQCSRDGSCSQSDAIINMVVHCGGFACTCDPGYLSIISDSRPSSTPSNNSDTVSNAVLLLPWLVSLGRCYMGYARLLQQFQDGADTVWGQVAAAAQTCPDGMRNTARDLHEVAAVLPAWLQSSSVSAQLATAGYSTQRVIELLQFGVQAGQDAAQAGPAAAAAVAVPPELLLQLGLALSNLPVGTACNNPHCSSLAGVSEQQLVVRRSCLCASCRVARYCCRACQVAAWKQHKPACKAVACAHATKLAE